MPLFKTAQNHICTIYEPMTDDPFGAGLLKSEGKWKRKTYSKIWKWITLWEWNPRTIEYYRSEVEMKQKRLEHISSYYWIIHPFSKLRSFYEIWMACIFTLQLVYIPLDMSLNMVMAFQPGYTRNVPRSHYVAIHLLYYISKWVTWIDIAINFFTGYEQHSKVVLKPRKIALHYLFSMNFLSDVLSSIPHTREKQQTKLQLVLDSFQILKIFRVPTCISYINRTAELFRIKNKWFDIGFFFAVMIVGLHWYSCVLFFIPQIRLYQNGVLHENSWLIREHSLESTFFPQYVHNLFIAATCVFCIYTNAPLTGIEMMKEGAKIYPPWEEQLTMIIYYISGKILTSLLIVILLDIFLSMRTLENKYEQVMTQVSMFMRQQQLPIPMQQKICKFYQYKYNRNYFRDTVVDHLLSNSLRSEIRYQECSSMISNVRLFARLPPYILGKILHELVPEIFMADDIILRHGGMGDCMYFLSSGTVAVYTPAGKEICHLQDGAHFGEVALVLKGKKRTATIKAVEICELYRLDKKPFKACFVKNTAIFEQLQETARERTENTDKMDVEFESQDRQRSMKSITSVK